MRRFHTLVLAFAMIICGIALTSATMPSATPAQSQVEVDAVAVAKQASEQLTLKERVALKIFKKKIGTIQKHASKEAKGGKSQLVALLLVIFVGGLGIHRFYLGYTWQGIVQILTGGGCGIWWLIDLIRIITGDLAPKGGAYEKTL